MVEGAIEGSGIAQKSGLAPIQVMHAFKNLDALGGIQRLKKYTRALKTQIHQQKIDVVVSSASGLQRMSCALLFFQALAHLLEVRARTSALAVANPIDGLQV